MPWHLVLVVCFPIGDGDCDRLVVTPPDRAGWVTLDACKRETEMMTRRERERLEKDGWGSAEIRSATCRGPSAAM